MANRPPLRQLHKWVACSEGSGSTLYFAERNAKTSLKQFLSEHRVAANGEPWVTLTELIRGESQPGREQYRVVLKVLVQRRV